MYRYCSWLLATLVFCLCLRSGPASAACPPPPEFTNVVTVQDGDVLVSFATDQQVYLLGQNVRFFLSFENTGTELVGYYCPYAPEYLIHILPDSCLSYGEAGCDTLASRLPNGVYWYSPGIWLDPGECYATVATLDEDNIDFPPAPGVYRAHGGLPSSFEEFSVPSGGAELFFVVGSTSGIVTPTPGVYANTWGRIKALYD